MIWAAVLAVAALATNGWSRAATWQVSLIWRWGKRRDVSTHRVVEYRHGD